MPIIVAVSPVRIITETVLIKVGGQVDLNRRPPGVEVGVGVGVEVRS